MLRLGVVVACAFIATTTVMATSNLDLQVSAKFENVFRNDVRLNDVVVMTSRARSKAECARHCVERQDCVTFTFNSRSRSCRGHSSLMTSTSAVIVDVGSETFQIKGQIYRDLIIYIRLIYFIYLMSFHKHM